MLQNTITLCQTHKVYETRRRNTTQRLKHETKHYFIWQSKRSFCDFTLSFHRHEVVFSPPWPPDSWSIFVITLFYWFRLDWRLSAFASGCVPLYGGRKCRWVGHLYLGQWVKHSETSVSKVSNIFNDHWLTDYMNIWYQIEANWKHFRGHVDQEEREILRYSTNTSTVFLVMEVK